MKLVRILGLALAGSALILTAQGCTASTDDSTGDTGQDEGGSDDLRKISHCGGFAGLTCSGGLTCVDDPIDSCSPANGGRDCSGLCVNTKTAPKCGGIAGLTCATGLTCVDNPSDGCDPTKGGADCMGVCVKAVCDSRLALTVTCKPGTAWDQTQCKCAAPETRVHCTTMRCSSGYHCEEKGLNGGSVGVCIRDAGDCRTTGCGASQWCSACWGSFACIPKGAMC